MGFGVPMAGEASPNQMAIDKAKKDAKKNQTTGPVLMPYDKKNKKTGPVLMPYDRKNQTTGPMLMPYDKMGGGNQVVQSSTPKVPTVPEPVTPTTAEVSQSTATDADEYDLITTKKKGRSMTTLTSSQGVTDDKLILGKKSLLGA